MRRHALHVITTGMQSLEEVEPAVGRLGESLDVDVLHIREKSRTAREHLAWYGRLLAAAPRLAIAINDRVDAAAACGAPYVQLGYTSVPPEAARRMLPPGTRIGCSVHTIEEAVRAAAAGADYVLFGHIYTTASKQGLEGRGPGLLAEIVRACPVPVIAIGGIGPEQVGEVLATGCAGIAVLSSILGHAQPAEQARRFRAALDACRIEPKLRFFPSIEGGQPHE